MKNSTAIKVSQANLNINKLLSVFSTWKPGNETPEARMVAQLNWLEEFIKRGSRFPLEPEELSTLRYIYADGTLDFHASKKDPETKFREIGLPMANLISIAIKDRVILEKSMHDKVDDAISALIACLENANRDLSPDEVKFVNELTTLKSRLDKEDVELPIRSHLPDYPGYTAVRGFRGNTIDDIPTAKGLFKIFREVAFDGVVPDEWVQS